MKNKISQEDLVKDFLRIGIRNGDTILIRASLGDVGRLDGGANTFIDALLNCVGVEGTLVSLAFTGSAFVKMPKVEDAFDIEKKSYAGALPNAMLKYPGAVRSTHPTCSFVAIGKYAKKITERHNETSPAYEPVRTIIELDGKCMLVGCVSSSPGFTTTHLAEVDLGLSKRIIFPWLSSTYYRLPNNKYALFRRRDPGLCSNSYYKFYSLYVREKILFAGDIANAYSIVASAKHCYEVDVSVLRRDRQFNVCESKYCFTCNAGRWDRLHCLLPYVFRKSIRILVNKFERKK